MKKKESADIKNVELLNDNDLDDGEDFMENFNKSIKVCFALANSFFPKI